MTHQFPRVSCNTNEHGETLDDTSRTLLCLTHFLNDIDEHLWGDVEILGNVLCDEPLDVIHRVLRERMPGLFDYKALLRSPLSGLPKLGSVF